MPASSAKDVLVKSSASVSKQVLVQNFSYELKVNSICEKISLQAEAFSSEWFHAKILLTQRQRTTQKYNQAAFSFAVLFIFMLNCPEFWGP